MASPGRRVPLLLGPRAAPCAEGPFACDGSRTARSAEQLMVEWFRHSPGMAVLVGIMIASDLALAVGLVVQLV